MAVAPPWLSVVYGANRDLERRDRHRAPKWDLEERQPMPGTAARACRPRQETMIDTIEDMDDATRTIIGARSDGG